MSLDIASTKQLAVVVNNGKTTLPSYIVKILRQRIDLEEDDSSRDRDFSSFSSLEVLCEITIWNLGFPTWFIFFIGRAKALGIDFPDSDISPIPLDICMRALRERVGLEPDDKSRDDEFTSLSPMEKLGELTAWEMGDPSWAESFVRWAKDCGVTVTNA